MVLAVLLNNPSRRRGPARPTRPLHEDRPTAAVAEQNEVPIGEVVEDRDTDLERRTRVYAGMRTFISVMPWIRFE